MLNTEREIHITDLSEISETLRLYYLKYIHPYMIYSPQKENLYEKLPSDELKICFGCVPAIKDGRQHNGFVIYDNRISDFSLKCQRGGGVTHDFSSRYYLNDSKFTFTSDGILTLITPYDDNGTTTFYSLSSTHYYKYWTRDGGWAGTSYSGITPNTYKKEENNMTVLDFITEFYKQETEKEIPDSDKKLLQDFLSSILSKYLSVVSSVSPIKADYERFTKMPLDEKKINYIKDCRKFYYSFLHNQKTMSDSLELKIKPKGYSSIYDYLTFLMMVFEDQELIEKQYEAQRPYDFINNII